MTIDAYGVAGELRFTGPVSFTSRTVGEVCWDACVVSEATVTATVP
ncbi:MAG: hypothetical protein JNG84_01410 [Archangium sp.]|nr:hypothetical protein [Archangium sp.]